MMENATELKLTFTGWVSDLARHHTAALAGVARAEGLSATDALDAVQEAFATLLRLPQARSLVGAVDDSRSVLVAIVRNAARNIRRRHHRAQPHVSLEDDGSPANPLPSVDEIMLEAEQHVQLQGCVNRLGEIQRHVVTMRMLEEVSGVEVASKLELEPGYVAVLLHRAKKELLRCMME